MEMTSTALLIVSHDDALLEALGGKLRQWGATVHHHNPLESRKWPLRIVDVILVDVRQQTEKMFAGLRDIHASLPFVEMVLINSSGNVNGSMAGMRAGASDELIVPFDVENLRQKVTEACRRSRKKSSRKHSRTLLQVFEDAMSAVAFAQAGEFEIAISMLEASDSADGKKDSNMEKQGGSKRSNERKR